MTHESFNFVDNYQTNYQTKQARLIALLITLLLHAAIGVGLVNIKTQHIPALPKQTPIQVEFLNAQQSQTPSETPEPTAEQPIVEQKVAPQKVEPKKAATKITPKPQETKPVEQPIKKAEAKLKPTETVKNTEPEIKPEAVKKVEPVVEPKIVKTEQVEVVATTTQHQSQMQVASQPAESAVKAQAEKSQAPAKSAEAPATQNAQANTSAESESKAKAGAEAQARATNVAKATAQNDNTPISINITAASWRSKPNLHFDVEESMDFKPTTTSITVSFNFDEKGKISNVSISSTGDSQLDRKIKTRIARASLHPQKENGVARSGRATVTLQISL